MAFFTALATGLAIAGAGADVVSKIKAGNAAKREAELRAQALEASGAAANRDDARAAAVAEFNAKVAELQAKDALVRGAQDESKFRASVRGLIGTQRADYAASNIDVSYGSAADVQAETAFQGELDALTIHTNTAREAWGYRVEAANQRAGGGGGTGNNAALEARFLRLQGAEAQSQSRLSAGAGLVGVGLGLLNTYRPRPRVPAAA